MKESFLGSVLLLSTVDVALMTTLHALIVVCVRVCVKLQRPS